MADEPKHLAELLAPENHHLQAGAQKKAEYDAPPVQRTDDDRDIRNFLGGMALVVWGVVATTLLTVHDYNEALLGAVAVLAAILTGGFLFWRQVKTHIGLEYYQGLARLASNAQIHFAIVAFLVVWLVVSGLLQRYREIGKLWLGKSAVVSSTNVSRKWPTLTKTEIHAWGSQLAEFKAQNLFPAVIYTGDASQPLAITLGEALKAAHWPDPDISPQDAGKVGMHTGCPANQKPVADRVQKFVESKFKMDVPIETESTFFAVYVGLLPSDYERSE